MDNGDIRSCMDYAEKSEGMQNCFKRFNQVFQKGKQAGRFARVTIVVGMPAELFDSSDENGQIVDVVSITEEVVRDWHAR